MRVALSEFVKEAVTGANVFHLSIWVEPSIVNFAFIVGKGLANIVSVYAGM